MQAREKSGKFSFGGQRRAAVDPAIPDTFSVPDVGMLYELGKTLGGGTTATVRQATWRSVLDAKALRSLSSNEWAAPLPWMGVGGGGSGVGVCRPPPHAASLACAE